VLGTQVTWTADRPDEVLIEGQDLRVFFGIGDDKGNVTAMRFRWISRRS